MEISSILQMRSLVTPQAKLFDHKIQKFILPHSDGLERIGCTENIIAAAVTQHTVQLFQKKSRSLSLLPFCIMIPKVLI